MNSATPILTHYDRRTVALHWLSAILVALLWGLGQTIDWFPKGLPRTGARSTHVVLGVILVFVVAYRLAWRAGGGARLPVASGWLGTMTRAGHGLLYALLIAGLLSGLANVWVRGDNIFNLLQVPAIDPGNRELRHNVGNIHEWAVNALLLLALVHVAIALAHHYWLKDEVLRRILPQRGLGPSK